MSKTLYLSMALLLAGCAVGPDYETPVTAEPETFHALDQNGDVVPSRDFATTQQQFWAGFDDPQLAGLIGQALDANLTLRQGEARYRQAAALLGLAQRNRWPSLTLDAGAGEYYPAEVESAGSSMPERYNAYDVSAQASWELDFFGRLQRVSESQQAELEAASADLQALQVAIVAELAGTYFQLRGLQQQLLVGEENVGLYEQSLHIISARVDAGRGTDFDRVRAQAQLERARAQLPVIEADIRAAMHRIAVLTGQTPAALIEQLAVVERLPAVNPAIAVDSPANVLRRRPDVAAAERRLAASTARIGVAVADLFPRFTLGGLIGSVAADSGDLFSGPAESRHVTLGIDWTFLDYAKVQARIDAADAESQAALAQYQQAVLTALEEAESRLVFYDRIQQRVDSLNKAEAQATTAVELARSRYRDGFIGYFEVLQAEQELALAKESRVQARTSEVLAMVNVYRALAGPPG